MYKMYSNDQENKEISIKILPKNSIILKCFKVGILILNMNTKNKTSYW